jgi:hypothetical protein
MADGSRRWGILALAGTVLVASIAIAWKLSTNDSVVQAAETDSQTLPPLDDKAPPPPVRMQEPEVALTAEQRRLKRYDKDDNGAVGREEYLLSRRKAFAKLDTDSSGTLSFDEYAVKTIDKFDKADADNNSSLSEKEFALTAQKRAQKKPVECPPEDRKDDQAAE